MGLFEQFLGKIRFTIEDKEFQMEVLNLEEAGEMMHISDVKDSEKFKATIDFLSKIMRKNYPEEDSAEIETFVVKYNNMIFEELMIGMNWATRDGLKEATEKAQAESEEASKKKI